jgi:hypothetical protein
MATSAYAAPPALPQPGRWDLGFSELLLQQARVATVGFRLAVDNNALCDTHFPQAGWVVQDPMQYRADMRADAVRFFGMKNGFTVMLVVPDGPAAHAGLMAGDAITAVDGKPVAALPTDASGQKASQLRIDRFSGTMGAAMRAGPTTLSVQRGSQALTVILTPIMGCASRTELSLSSGIDSYADGGTATITAEFVAYTRDDDELAVVLGHETAHNVHHDHPGPGRRQGRIEAGTVSTRESETEADYTDLYLMAHAGYDYHKASEFWRRFGKDHGLGILASPSHPGWTKRAKRALDTAAEIDAKKAQNAPLIPNLPVFDRVRAATR